MPHEEAYQSDFYVVVDMNNQFSLGMPTLFVKRSSSDGLSYSAQSFNLVPDSANQSIVSPVDGDTTPYVFKLEDSASYDSFIDSADAAGYDGETNWSFSFDVTPTFGCRNYAYYTNHIRVGDVSNLLNIADFTYYSGLPTNPRCSRMTLDSYQTTDIDSVNNFLSSF